MVTQCGQWLSVSLSVVLTVVLFSSLGHTPVWVAVYGAIGLVLSITQFSLPMQMRNSYRNGQTALLLGLGTLFLLLQVVSLSASVGSLSASLGQVSAQGHDQRALLLRQIQQEQDRVAVWNDYEKPSKANQSQALIRELRAELKALPVPVYSSALSLVTTLASLTGYAWKTVASVLYIVLSVLLDACAVYFLLLPSMSQTITVQEHRPVQQELLEDSVDIPYQAIVTGVCKLSVRSIMDHYGIGSSKTYDILRQLQDQGLVIKDQQTNRYRLTEKAENVRV